jgi:hypothetical protein
MSARPRSRKDGDRENARKKMRKIGAASGDPKQRIATDPGDREIGRKI